MFAQLLALVLLDELAVAYLERVGMLVSSSAEVSAPPHPPTPLAKTRKSSQRVCLAAMERDKKKMRLFFFLHPHLINNSIFEITNF